MARRQYVRPRVEDYGRLSVETIGGQKRVVATDARVKEADGTLRSKVTLVKIANYPFDLVSPGGGIPPLANRISLHGKKIYSGRPFRVEDPTTEGFNNGAIWRER